MEVLKDCNIQFYEGNLILQVYDHTNTVDVKHTQKKPADNNVGPNATPHVQSGAGQGPAAANTASPTPSGTPQTSQTSGTETGAASSDAAKHSEDKKDTKEVVATFKRPRVYRTLLRPNGLTHYYDMLSYADHTRFSDNIYQQLEAEILTLTKRNLKLDVPLNPFEHHDKLDESMFCSPEVGPRGDRIEHVHRDTSKKRGTKGQVGHIELHEESPQHSSSYEQMMLIMSERTTTTTMSTIAASLAKNAADLTNSSLKSGGGKGSSNVTGTPGRSNGSSSVAAAAVAAAAAVGSSSNDNNQFSRLKFVEQWRINKEKRKQQALNANIAPTTAYNQRISMAAPLTAQQIKQQQLLQQQQQQQSGDQQRVSNKRTGDEEKGKTKKQRKTVKKAAPTTAAGEAPKKKKPTKKK